MRLKSNTTGSTSARISAECDAVPRFHAELVTAPKGTSALAHHALIPSVRDGCFFMLQGALAEFSTGR